MGKGEEKGRERKERVEIDVSVPDYIDFGGWEAGNELNVKYTTRVKKQEYLGERGRKWAEEEDGN